MKRLIITICCLLTIFLCCACDDVSDSTQKENTDTNTADGNNTNEVTSNSDITTEETTVETTGSFNYIEVNNPVCSTGNDPWIVEHNGEYFYCFSRNNGVAVKKVDDLTNITPDGASQVYSAPSGRPYSNEYWAPELHYIDGVWYIYVAADNGDNANHRMYVLRGTSQDPTKLFTFVGKISDSTNKWAIDGTVLQYHGELYFIWSGWEGDENDNQNIYIAHMSNPWTIDSERVLLSSPQSSWERKGAPPGINEGPTALVNGEDVFIIYSASGSWTDDYCLGRLRLTGENLLDKGSWEKASIPVFRRLNGVAYGPGHCSFTKTPDGETWMIYHANLVSGTSWDGRSVWIQPVKWDDDGLPVLGRPNAVVEYPVEK